MRSPDEEADTPSTINPSVAMAVAGNQFGLKPPPLALTSVVSPLMTMWYPWVQTSPVRTQEKLSTFLR